MAAVAVNGGRRRLAICLAAWLPFWAVTSVFAGVATAAPASARTIEIVIAGPDTFYQAVAAALGPLLQNEEGVRVRPRTTSDLPPVAKAGILIEAGQKGSVRIVVFSGRGRAVERQINGRELTPVTVEIVAQIAHDAARALLVEEAGDAAPDSAPDSTPDSAPDSAPAAPTEPLPHAAMEPPPRPSSPPSSSGPPAITREETLPSPPEARDKGFTFVVDAGVATRLIFDPELVFYNSPSSHTQKGFAGALTVIRHHPTINAFLSLMVDETWAATPPFGANVGYPALDITSFSGRALAGLAWRPAPYFAVHAGLGAGADHVAAKAGSTGGGSAWLSGARGLVRFAALLPRTPFEVWAALTVDARPRAKFAVSSPAGSPGGTLAFYNTAPVQPGVAVGIGWRL